MFGLGGMEVLVILVVGVVVLGPERLPKVMRAFTRVMSEFRRVSTELQRTINTELDFEEITRQQKAKAKTTSTTKKKKKKTTKAQTDTASSEPTKDNAALTPKAEVGGPDYFQATAANSDDDINNEPDVKSTANNSAPNGATDIKNIEAEASSTEVTTLETPLQNNIPANNTAQQAEDNYTSANTSEKTSDPQAASGTLNGSESSKKIKDSANTLENPSAHLKSKVGEKA